MTPRAMVIRSVVVIVTLIVIGTVTAVYVIAHQGSGWDPRAHVYEIKAEFTQANGIASLGQPVNVAGVKVGSVTAADVAPDGNALVTMEIDRGQLRRVHADATAAIVPITPLGDLSIDLAPGAAPARVLRPGATIGVGRTSGPVPLESLLASLDADTRAFATSLITALQQGTAGRAGDLRRAMLTLGPTADSVGELSARLARRRTALARLVHNLARVTNAASRDHQLASVVAAGNGTLAAVASEDDALRASIAQLPSTMRAAAGTLDSAGRLARQITPTVTELLPAVERLPPALAATRPLTGEMAAMLRTRLRPSIKSAQPVARDLGSATPSLTRMATPMVSVFQELNYLLNVLGYNPPGDNEGNLFWMSWWFHNWNSILSSQDAHGTIARATVLTDCSTLASALETEITTVFRAATGLGGICPTP